MFVLQPQECELSLKDEILKLPPQETALLGVYFIARLENWPGAGPYGVGRNHHGWIRTADFIIAPAGSETALDVYFSLYAKALGHRDPAPLQRLFYLAHKDPTALQQFFQRKRTLLDQILRNSSTRQFTRLRLKSSKTKPHRAGIILPRNQIVLI